MYKTFVSLLKKMNAKVIHLTNLKSMSPRNLRATKLSASSGHWSIQLMVQLLISAGNSAKI